MRSFAISLIFVLSMFATFGCKSEAAKTSTGYAKATTSTTACEPFMTVVLCQTYDVDGNLVDGKQTCNGDGSGFGMCRPFDVGGTVCSPGDTFVDCNCDDFGNLGSAQCLSDGSRWSWGVCICYGDDGAGGGSNTSTTTDTGTGGSAPTTTSTTTETNSGTGGGDAGQGGQGGGNVQPEPESCFLKNSFDLPNDAIPNNNQYIGPFCCTGETIVVERADHVVLGYAYFYAWEGQAFMCEDGSYAPDLTILISSATPPFPKTNNASEQITDELPFAQGEVAVDAQKSMVVGGLVYTAKIINADMKDWDGAPMFNMQTLKVQLNVELAPGMICDP